jgi:hypothetical protein
MIIFIMHAPFLLASLRIAHTCVCGELIQHRIGNRGSKRFGDCRAYAVSSFRQGKGGTAFRSPFGLRAAGQFSTPSFFEFSLVPLSLFRDHPKPLAARESNPLKGQDCLAYRESIALGTAGIQS